MLIQFFEREHAYREVYTDGRGHPADLDPTWMGHSIGKWDGDTFVIDSVGFNDKAWIDFFGNPRSEQLHLTERWKRVDHDHLTMQIIADDPGAYTKTWVGDTKYFSCSRPRMRLWTNYSAFLTRRTPSGIVSGSMLRMKDWMTRATRTIRSRRRHRGRIRL
jgi:hypothetical protein